MPTEHPLVALRISIRLGAISDTVLRANRDGAWREARTHDLAAVVAEVHGERTLTLSSSIPLSLPACWRKRLVRL